MEIRKGQGNQAAMARLIFNKGLVYFNRSDYQRANDCNLQAFEVFKKEKDSFLMAKMLNSVGINYMYLSQYSQSLDAYMQAKSIYEDLQLQENLEYANITSNIGLLYAHLEKPKLAQQFQEVSLERFRKLDFSEGIANSLTNLGRLHTDQGDTDRAIELYQEAYEIMQNIHNERGMASALTNIGIAHVEEERYRAALPFFEKTKDIYIKLSNSNNLAIVYENIGDCHYHLYEQLGKPSDLRAAHTNFSNSLSEAKKAMSVKLQQTAHEDLAKTLLTMGDAKRAYQNLTESIVLKDSFMSIDKKEEIARLEAKYEYEKEKTQLQSAFDQKEAVAQAKLEKQRLISVSILFGSLLFLAALGIGFILYKKRNDAVLDKKKAEFNAQVAETELKALRSQMNPHFIFNSLNSIRDYMAKNDLEQAESYLMKFAKLTRAILENSDKSWISLDDDLQLMKMYIEIESLRLQHPLAYSIEVVDEVDVENTLVPPMILQPFIENSIWHGVSGKPDQGKIKIRVAVENEF